MVYQYVDDYHHQMDGQQAIEKKEFLGNIVNQ
jgi:hypothetical protein